VAACVVIALGPAGESETVAQSQASSEPSALVEREVTQDDEPESPGQVVQIVGGGLVGFGVAAAVVGAALTLSATSCIGPCIGGGSSGDSDPTAGHVLLVTGGAMTGAGLLLLLTGGIMRAVMSSDEGATRTAAITPTIGVTADSVTLGAGGTF